MKIEINSIYRATGLIGSLIALVFGAGVWATQMYVVVEQTRVDQVQSAKQIIESIDGQTESIRMLTSTLADHETRLRVNEIRIEDLSKKANHK